MEYAAVAVAILGIAIGATFRLRFLLGMIFAVLATTFVFVLSHPYGIIKGLLIIMVAQALLQAGYFAGLVGRVFFSKMLRILGGLSEPKPESVRQNREG